MDATFGIGLSRLDFFVLVFVHPTTQVPVVLAHFIRLKGSNDDQHPLIPDLVWMQQKLEVFGFEPPRYTIVDKCAASLGAFAEEVKGKWAACSDSSGHPVGLLKDVLDKLAVISNGVTAPEKTAFEQYLTDVQETCGTSLPTPCAADVVITEESKNAAAYFFGPWARQNPTLIRALAKSLSDELIEGAAAVASAKKSAGAVNNALERLQSFAWVVTDNDSPLAKVFRRLVERWIRLCFFHAKKAISEHLARSGMIPAKEVPQVWTGEIEPFIDGIFGASPGKLKTLWETFKVDYGIRYPDLISYLEENWMSPEWVQLWTGSGRFTVGHFFVETSNYAENLFRQLKGGPVMGGKMPSDAAEVLEEAIGKPSNPYSIWSSYFNAQCIKISDIQGRATNMRFPDRKKISFLREYIERFLAEGRVRDVPGSEGTIYAVERRAGRAARAWHYLNMYHGCPCNEPNYFCKHLLAARIFHLRKERERCWRDSELSPYYDEDVSTAMPTEEIFSSIHESTVKEVLLTPEAARAAQAKVTAILNATFNGLMKRMQSLMDTSAPILSDGATSEEIRSFQNRTRSLGQLVERTTVTERVADSLLGKSPPALGGVRKFPKAARSSDDVAKQLSAQLSFPGEMSPTAAGMVRVVNVGVNLGDLDRRESALSAASKRSRSETDNAASEAEKLKGDLDSMRSQLREMRDKIKKLNEDIATLTGKLKRREDRIASLTATLAETEEELGGAYEEGVAAAYADGLKRVQDVKQTYYTQSPEVGKAFDALARGFSQLMREEKGRAKLIRASARERLRRQS